LFAKQGFSTSHTSEPILVFGATGQQGASVATALLKAAWRAT
jgi:hypothetical protein